MLPLKNRRAFVAFTPTFLLKLSMFKNRYFLLVLLTCAYILSFIDRHVMAVLVEPIQADFAINDTQFALLNGLAFSLLYTSLAIPIAVLADRRSRKNIISIGVAFWSAMTFVCGLTTGFFTLFLARMGVGVGEAALSPPAHSLLSDYFSKKNLPSVMAIFTLGIPVGIGASFSIGGWAYGYFTEIGGLTLPLLGFIKPWQLTLMLVSLPGFVIGLLIFLMQEPKRHNVLKLSGQSGGGEVQGFKQAVVYLRANKGVYFNVFLGVACVSLVAYSHMMWFIEHMHRSLDIPVVNITPTYGSINLVFGIAGTLLGAALAKGLSVRGHQDAGLKTTLFFIVLMFMPYLASTLSTDTQWVFIWVAICTLCFNGYFGLAIAALQLSTPNQFRAQTSALLIFAANVSGLMIGPVLVGFLSDSVFTGSRSLGFALASIAVLFIPLAGFLLFSSLQAYRGLLCAINEKS